MLIISMLPCYTNLARQTRRCVQQLKNMFWKILSNSHFTSPSNQSCQNIVPMNQMKVLEARETFYMLQYQIIIQLHNGMVINYWIKWQKGPLDRLSNFKTEGFFFLLYSSFQIIPKQKGFYLGLWWNLAVKYWNLTV